ncbi:integral membrane protein [Metarhizium guizhouense ARSEF 977]|uniref:Integral membrane protein n=1 Tax=Metarhizium guizhouense (strain ARSEF 977) TaxID=1276136 RepID=A0A0B4HGP7_METGA|nr:integral membrane protein [Metarhizium guizhouense ARSEF 977]
MSVDAGRGLPATDKSYSSDWLLIIVFISIALYNVVELNFLIATTFKRFRGLYFWSFTCSTWGIAFNAVGYLLRHVHPNQLGYLHATLILIGWCAMINGQSLVLYSRLHIVMHHPRRLRFVLAMIIFDAVWLSVPVIVLVYGTNSGDPGPFEQPYSIFEKLQLTVFFVQEVVISSLYIVETTRLLKMQRGIASSSMRRVMGHLILVNVFVVLLDVSILCLQFTEHYNLQTAWKALVYSVKLKCEFSVLNRLVEFSQHLRAGHDVSSVNYDASTDVALERYLRNASQAPAGAEYSMQVTAERPCENGPPEIVKTTAVTVSRSGRSAPPTRPSTAADSSLGGCAADEMHDADGTSSLSSEARLARP